MKTLTPRTCIVTLFTLLALGSGLVNAAPLGAAFTYQGQLNAGGNPATGSYDLTFTLFNASNGGSVVAGPRANNAVLVNTGQFTVTLDFGGAAFNGDARWLQIAARTNGVGSYTVLSPRQLVPLMPYALYSATAGTVQATNLSGILPDTLLSTNVARLNTNAVFNGTPVFTGGMTLMQGPAGTTAWDVSVRDYLYSGTVFPNLLQFSTGGEMRMGILPDGHQTLIYGGLSVFPNSLGGGNIHAAGDIEVGGDFPYGNGKILLSKSGSISASGDLHAANIYGNVIPPSDRNLKEEFAPIDNGAILELVARLPISSWNFKSDPATRHIGPMAQDFYAAFDVGPDDKHIATIDADGVALAAIQGLNQKLADQVKAQAAEIQSLRLRLEKLEQIITQNR